MITLWLTVISFSSHFSPLVFQLSNAAPHKSTTSLSQGQAIIVLLLIFGSLFFFSFIKGQNAKQTPNGKPRCIRCGTVTKKVKRILYCHIDPTWFTYSPITVLTTNQSATAEASWALSIKLAWSWFFWHGDERTTELRTSR